MKVMRNFFWSLGQFGTFVVLAPLMTVVVLVVFAIGGFLLAVAGALAWVALVFGAAVVAVGAAGVIFGCCFVGLFQAFDARYERQKKEEEQGKP